MSDPFAHLVPHQGTPEPQPPDIEQADPFAALIPDEQQQDVPALTEPHFAPSGPPRPTMFERVMSKLPNYAAAAEGSVPEMQFMPNLFPAGAVQEGEQGRLSSAAGTFLQSAGRMMTSIPKKAAIDMSRLGWVHRKAFEEIDRGEYDPSKGFHSGEIYLYYHHPEERQKLRQQLKLLLEEPMDPRESDIYKAGEKADQWFAETFKSNPRFREEFLSGTLPNAAGSAFGFLFAGAVTRSRASPAVLGSMSQGTEGFEDALRNGASIEDAFRSSNLNALVGTTEALPISRILSRADKFSGGGIRRLLLDMGKGGTEELIQENFQQITSNLIASKVVKYDPDRNMWVGTGEDENAAFTTGALMQLVASMSGLKIRGKAPSVEPSTSEAVVTEPAAAAVAPAEDLGPFEGLVDRPAEQRADDGRQQDIPGSDKQPAGKAEVTTEKASDAKPTPDKKTELEGYEPKPVKGKAEPSGPLSDTTVPRETKVKTQQLEGNFNIRVGLKNVASVPVGVEKVGSAEEAAHVLSHYRRHPQENMLALVLDKDGRPITIIRNNLGVKNASQVDPATYLGSILSIPNAKTFYMGHNHPGGLSEPSIADNKLTQKIKDLAVNSGLKYGGHVVLGAGRKAHLIDENQKSSAIQTAAKPRSGRLGVTERVFTKRSEVSLAIKDSKDAKNIVRDLKGTGVLLLDSKNMVTGYLPLSEAEMAKMKGDTKSPLERLLRAAHETNASAAIIRMESENEATLQNIASAINAIGLRPLDAIVHTKPAGKPEVILAVSELEGHIRTGETFHILHQKQPKILASTPGQKYAAFINTAAIPEPTEVPADPVRRDQIIKRLAKRLGIPVYTGRIKGNRKELGFYRPKIDEVRIKNRDDLEVTAHEIAHFIDYNVPEIKKAYKNKAFREEIRGVSYDAKKLEEGFAEFVRLWATQEHEAIQRAPQFYEWFEDWVNNNKKYGPALIEAKAAMQAWYNQGALNRLKSNFGKSKVSIRDRLEAYSDRFIDTRIAKTLDGIHGLKVAELDLVGTIESANQSPTKAMRLVAGARAIVKKVLNDGTPRLDKNGNLEFSGEGLRHVLNPVNNKLEDWAAYMIARRSKELRAQGREKLITIDQEKAGLELGQDTDIREARKRYREFNNRMMDFYQQLGLISNESRAAMEEANEEYIPFNRVIEAFDGKLEQKAGNPMKRLHGSDRRIDDIVDNITSNIGVMVHRGLVNKAKLMAYDMVSSSRKGAKYAVKIPTTSKKIAVSKDEVRRAFLESLGLTEETMGAAPAGLRKHFNNIFNGLEDLAQFWVHGQAPIGHNIDSVMRDGKLEYYEVADPLFFKAMEHYGHRDMHMALRFLGGAKTILTRGVTIAPDFMIPNLLRDTAMGYLFSKSGMKPLVGSCKGLWDRLSNDQAYKEFILNGGGYSSTVHGETKALRRDLEKMYKDAGIDYKAVLDSPAKMAQFWDEFNSAFEYGTRLNEYKRLRALGVSPREAAFQGREITTDFAMRGYSDFVRGFTTSVPFLNAGMQGLYRIGRGFTSVDEVKNEQGEVVGRTDPVQLTVKALATITIPSLMLLYLNYDDDRYKELDDWVKDLHWVILLPKGTEERLGIPEIYTIPKPFEVGAIFASIPERIALAFMDRDGEKFMQSLGWIISHQFRLEPWRIQLFQPIIETEISNRKFNGAPIVPEDLQGVEAFEQYKPYTPETAIELGRTFNISPLKIEHWVRGYFGYMGMYALQGTDALLGTGRGERPEKRIDEYPVFRRLTRQQPLRSTSYETEYYGMVKESEKVVATFDKMMREFRPEAADQYLKEQGRHVAKQLSRTLRKIRAKASRLRSNMAKVQNNPNMSGKEKRKKINQLQFDMNKLMKQAATKLNKKEFAEFRARVELRR